MSVGHILGPNTLFNTSPSFLDLVAKAWTAISFRCALCFLGHHSVLIIIPFEFIELFAHVFFKLLGIFDEAYDFFLKFYVLGAHLGISHWRTLLWTRGVLGGGGKYR